MERGAWLILVVVLAGLNLYQILEERPESTLPAEAGDEPEMDLPDPVTSEVRTPGLSDYEQRQFKRRGLTDPQQDILQHLLERPELIPQDPVLGGTMFFVPETTFLLSDRWVMATYEDGHIQGQALFRYQVSPKGEISWQILDSHRD